MQAWNRGKRIGQKKARQFSFTQLRG